MRHRAATDIERSGIGLDGAGDDFDQRRLSCPVFADQRMHFCFEQIEGYVLQSANARERLADRLGFQQRRGHYLMNASGKPPSTGMMWPVVFALSSLASQTMARAQSSGRMGLRVSVRWA